MHLSPFYVFVQAIVFVPYNTFLWLRNDKIMPRYKNSARLSSVNNAMSQVHTCISWMWMPFVCKCMCTAVLENTHVNMSRSVCIKLYNYFLFRIRDNTILWVAVVQNKVTPQFVIVYPVLFVSLSAISLCRVILQDFLGGGSTILQGSQLHCNGRIRPTEFIVSLWPF